MLAEIPRTMLDPFLLIAGLLFPTLSLVTVVLSLATRWKTGRHASPVLIPFIGPVLLTVWIIVTARSDWFMPVVWLLDPGTVVFLAVLPRLVGQWWRISVFTRLMLLRGTHGIETAILTLHRGGRYFLRKSWNRPQDQLGIIGLGETGTFAETGDAFELESDHGLKRRIRRVDENSFHVEEPGDRRPELRDYSLDGWILYP